MNNKLTHVLLTYLPRPIVIFIVLMVEPVYWLITLGLLGFGSLLLGAWFVGSFLFMPTDSTELAIFAFVSGFIGALILFLLFLVSGRLVINFIESYERINKQLPTRKHKDAR